MSHKPQLHRALVSVCFFADQATYLIEEVKPPPVKFIMNDEILDAFAGPEGIWHIMKEEHVSRGGEAIDDEPGGDLMEVVQFVDKVLKCRANGDKILVSGAFLNWHWPSQKAGSSIMGCFTSAICLFAGCSQPPGMHRRHRSCLNP